MFCHKCGKEMNDSAKFCPACGWENEEKINVENVNNKAQEKKNSNLPIIIGLVVLLLIGGIVFFMMSSKNNSTEENEMASKNDIEKNAKVKNQWDGDYYIGEDGEYVKNTWAQYEDGWYYCGPDGKILKNQWIDNTFYVDENGKMLLNSFTPDGYFVGEDGVFVEGKTLQNSRTSPLLTRAKEVISRIDPTFAGSYVCKIDGKGNVYCHANYVDTVSWDERTYRYKRQVYSEDPSMLEKEANDYLFVFYKDVGTVKMYRIYNIVNKTDPTLAYSTFNSPDRVQVTKWNYEGSLQGDGGEKYNNYLMDLATFNSLK